MTGEQALLTVAEIGVAFAGFASVVTAFRRRGADDWSPQDALRLIRSGSLLRAIALPSLVGALAVVVLQFCNATGLGLRPGIAGYFAGLVYILLLSAASFARLLPIGRRIR